MHVTAEVVGKHLHDAVVLMVVAGREGAPRSAPMLQAALVMAATEGGMKLTRGGAVWAMVASGGGVIRRVGTSMQMLICGEAARVM